MPLLEVNNVSKVYTASGVIHRSARTKGKAVEALSRINLVLDEGEAFGVIGESGAGKTTLAAIITGLDRPSSGEVTINGDSQDKLDRKAWARRVQLVWQDPVGSLDPRQRIGDAIAEPLIIQGATISQALAQVERLISEVGLDGGVIERLPHELSGGQAQRAVIARALAINPNLVICDEPASALDAPVKVQIAELLMRLRRERNISYLMIAHDLPLVRKITETVAVMYRGVIVEQGPTSMVLDAPLHPYTRLLVDSDYSRMGAHPAPGLLQSGERVGYEAASEARHRCPFLYRCPRVTDRCYSDEVILKPVGERQVACFAVRD